MSGYYGDVYLSCNQAQHKKVQNISHTTLKDSSLVRTINLLI